MWQQCKLQQHRATKARHLCAPDRCHNSHHMLSVICNSKSCSYTVCTFAACSLCVCAPEIHLTCMYYCRYIEVHIYRSAHTVWWIGREAGHTLDGSPVPHRADSKISIFNIMLYLFSLVFNNLLTDQTFLNSWGWERMEEWDSILRRRDEKLRLHVFLNIWTWICEIMKREIDFTPRITEQSMID